MRRTRSIEHELDEHVKALGVTGSVVVDADIDGYRIRLRLPVLWTAVTIPVQLFEDRNREAILSGIHQGQRELFRIIGEHIAKYALPPASLRDTKE